ncbi:hypothetical protein ACFRQM_15305 [Streptomyces sp. NPDC056831]|uniref:hypothetical protein n=1 Tax=Streptomyces sp. NPDC056831 TaxID=3345954 RepID=UPI00369A4B47
MPVLPSWPAEPLWEQFVAMLPERPAYAGCSDRRTTVIDAFFDLADTGITIRSLVCRPPTAGTADPATAPEQPVPGTGPPHGKYPRTCADRVRILASANHAATGHLRLSHGSCRS